MVRYCRNRYGVKMVREAIDIEASTTTNHNRKTQRAGASRNPQKDILVLPYLFLDY